MKQFSDLEQELGGRRNCPPLAYSLLDSAGIGLRDDVDLAVAPRPAGCGPWTPLDGFVLGPWITNSLFGS